MAIQLKICGMTQASNIKHVALLVPQYLGFIFFEASARHFTAASIPELPSNIKKVGVFVNASLQTVLQQVSTHQLQAVQLHGNESAEFCNALKNASNTLQIIKAFSVGNTFNFNTLLPYQNVCDFYLFDTKGALPGGNGYTFNWAILQQYTLNKPYFLSGGIGLDTVNKLNTFLKSEASKFCHAIDVNSKFETSPGLKHTEQLEQFIQQLQHHNLYEL